MVKRIYVEKKHGFDVAAGKALAGLRVRSAKLHSAVYASSSVTTSKA